jgi:hypothetical protein
VLFPAILYSEDDAAADGLVDLYEKLASKWSELACVRKPDGGGAGTNDSAGA